MDANLLIIDMVNFRICNVDVILWSMDYALRIFSMTRYGACEC